MRNTCEKAMVAVSTFGRGRGGALLVATTCAVFAAVVGCSASAKPSSDGPVGDVEQRSEGDEDPYAKYFVAWFTKDVVGTKCMTAAKARRDSKYCECWKTGDSVYSLYCGKGLPHSGGTGSAAGPNRLDDYLGGPPGYSW